MLRIDLNLVWTIINVIILYLLLKKFLIKPVTAIMDKREQMVKQGLEGARAQESRAKDREKAMKEMQSEVAGLALTAVSRILQEGTDPQSDGALYEQFLKKAGEANDTDR